MDRERQTQDVVPKLKRLTSKTADDIMNAKTALRAHARTQRIAFNSMIDLLWDHIETLESSVHITTTEQRKQSSSVDDIIATVEEMRNNYEELGKDYKTLLKTKNDVATNAKTLRVQTNRITTLSNKVSQLEKELKAEQDAYRPMPLSRDNDDKSTAAAKTTSSLQSKIGSGRSDSVKHTKKLESYMLVHLRWIQSGMEKLLQSPYSDGAAVHSAKDLKAHVLAFQKEVSQVIRCLDPSQGNRGAPGSVAVPSASGKPSDKAEDMDSTMRWIRIFNAQHGMSKEAEAKAKRCNLAVALWRLFVRVTRMLDRNATEQKQVASMDGQHIRVTRKGPWMLLEHITLPRDLLASNQLLNAIMDLAEMLRMWFQRRNEITITVAELAVRINQFEAAERESEQRTEALKGSIEGLNKTVRQQRNTIETLEHQHEQLAKDMNFLQGTVNEQREMLKQYQHAMMCLTDQTERLRQSIGIVDEKANTRGLQPPYPSVMGGEYPDVATSATVSSVIIRCLSCEQELDPVTSSRVLQNRPVKPYRAGPQPAEQPQRSVTVDVPRYVRPPSPVSADMGPSSNRVPMYARPQSAAVIRHNQRVLAANAKAKRPKSARVVHDNTPRGGELDSSGTHHFEAAAFDKAPDRQRSFRARRPLSSPGSGRGRARNGRGAVKRASTGRIEWRPKNSTESKS